jgi:type II secretory pathway predicted ATPase ExeA
MQIEGMYADFFGLSGRPFTLLPDPDFIFWSPQHKRAFSVLQYGIMARNPITLVSGEIGAGKTTLLQALLRQLDDTVVVGLISNAQGGRGELLRWVLNAFDIATGDETDYVTLFQSFQTFLVEKYAEGARVVLVIDEAQNLSAEGLEEVRMLTNINSGKDELIQLILVGQPELRDMVMRPDMKQLAQRVAASLHLTALSTKAAEEYILHRLKAVGGTGDEITPEAITLICERTGGIPRRINQMCDLAFVYAWGAEENPVSATTVMGLIEDGIILTDTSAPEPHTETSP